MQTGSPGPDQRQKDRTDEGLAGLLDEYEDQLLAWRNGDPDARPRCEALRRRVVAAVQGGRRPGGTWTTATERGRRLLSESLVRVSRVEAAIHDALAGCIEREPDTTVEEIIVALAGCTSREAGRLRAGQGTPAA